MNDRIPHTESDRVLVDVKALPSGWPTASLDPDSGRGLPSHERDAGPQEIHKNRSLRSQGIATHRQGGPLPERTIEVDNVDVAYTHLFDWIALATNLHLPAVAAPVTKTSSGLPIGVQLVGGWHDEHFLLDLAEALEQETGGFVAP